MSGRRRPATEGGQGGGHAVAAADTHLLNAAVAAHFDALSAHSDVADALLAAVKALGQYTLHGASRAYSAPYCVTSGWVFCAAAGMAQTYWRLRPEDVPIALATGGQRSPLGSEWVEFTVFRNDWPAPDLRHWAVRAYHFARSGR